MIYSYSSVMSVEFEYSTFGSHRFDFCVVTSTNEYEVLNARSAAVSYCCQGGGTLP